MSASDTPRLVRFGVFEFDTETGDLSKAGRRIRLQEQPRQALTCLVRHPDGLVTREELRAVLWPADTFVDFDTGLNVVVNKLRQALGDSAASPRFIETIPRRGYRFLAPVTRVATVEPAALESTTPPTWARVPASADPNAVAPAARRATGMWLRAGAVLALVLFVGGALWFARGEAVPPAESRIQTLAVLPLENLSGDAANDYFADGMTDALITDLASIHSLNVIARQSTKQYKGSTKTVSAIAKELGGVDAVIEGSVLHTGDRVRLIVQLIDARSEQHLWARTYEEDLTDILQLQRNAALTVAGEIRATLTREERARLRSARQVSPAAHDAYLRGQHWLARAATEPNTSRALVEFQRAIALDANYAPAHVGVALAQQIRGTFFGGRPPLETRPAAFRAARRALEIDPDLGEAHGVIGRLQLSEFDWPGADRSFARMVALAPGYPPGLSWYGYHLLLQRRFDAALETIKRAEALDPLNLNIRVTVGFIHSFRREYETSANLFEQVLGLDPDNMSARGFLIDAAAQLGRNQKAVAEATAAVERLGRSPFTLGRLANALGRAGDRRAAERAIAELLDMANHQYVSPGHLAFAYAALGDRDRAFEWLERAYEERSNMMMFYPVEPMFEWADDPRYLRLVQKIRQPHAVRDGS
jgi:TolB-like protein/DNA-binding winged helix-turn-helix (wHTH) protein/Tfp pilus assembly protein PilF